MFIIIDLIEKINNRCNVLEVTLLHNIINERQINTRA